MGNQQFSNAALYGKGTFTTVSIVASEPFVWSKHWNRLCLDSEKIGMDISDYSETLVWNSLNEAIATAGLINGRARITFVDEWPAELWSIEKHVCEKTTLSILTGEVRLAIDYFKLAISPFRINSRSPLAGVKSCNYLEQILALDEAKGRGLHEAVRVNERGHVTSGCMSNIFWLKNNRLYTPTLATGCLAGTTREYVLENVECGEVEAEIGELESADAIYLTSAGLGIVRVAELNGRELPDTKHPIQTLWPPS